MANKSDQIQPGRKSGSAVHRSSRSNEFDDAVTSDIPDDLESAFDEHQVGDPADLFVTDVSLTEHVDLDADDVLPPGFVLRDRFEIVALVYAAGMSHIYKAIDQRRCREGSGDIHVAIKIMRPSIASNELGRLALEREAARTQSLSHPNIINIFDFDNHDGQFFLVMEWLEGESANAMLRRTSGEAIEPELARTVITLAATGVQHAHQNNVVHADINPSNVFITDAREVKLLDFGVARFVSAPEQPEEERFTWVTQTYASPEVLSGSPPVIEDDVFSLACVVYRLLSGKHPFGGSPSLVAKRKGYSVDVIPGLPTREWGILRRALSYERSGRPTNVNDFVTWGATITDEDESTGGEDQGLMSPPRMWLAAAATVVVVAGGYWLTQRGADDESVMPVEPSLPEESAAAESAISASDALVLAATQALNEGQLVTPDEVSARALFRAALVLEPDNPEALRGLRAISNDFVQKASEALNRDNPIEAYASLAIATQTDSENATIGVVEELLTANGNKELADARAAVTAGDLDIAAQILSRAEQYQHIDPQTMRTRRQEIEERRQEDFLADQPEAADRSGEPTSDIEAAVAAQTIDEAEPLVVEEQADGTPATGDTESAEFADEQFGGATDPGDVESSRIGDEQLEDSPLQAAVSQRFVPEETVFETPTPAEPEIRRFSLQELGIREYVPPEFPRRARRRNISGMVEAKFVINPAGRTESIEILQSEPSDVFSQSAINAIDQWRFETREEPVDARITLRFAQE